MDITATTLHTANDPYGLVSVIVPIYNAQPYLDLALLTIEHQTHVNLEIICINDGSTDDSLATVKAHAAADDRYVVIDKPNEGYGATCNRGIAAARGVWISIVEPDDWLDVAMYHDMLAFAATFEEPLDIIKTPYWRVVNPDTAKERRYPCGYAGLVRPDRQPFELGAAPHLIGHHPSIWSALYRQSFLTDHGIRFGEHPGAGWADTPFMVDTLAQATAIAYLDRPYYHYREETDEAARAYIAAYPLIPITRWLTMDDTLKAHPQPASVNALHTATGFTYLRRIAQVHDLADPALAEGVARMFERMDDELVFSLAELSAAERTLYATAKGLPTPPDNRVAHAQALAAAALRRARTGGVPYVIDSVRSFLAARAPSER